MFGIIKNSSMFATFNDQEHRIICKGGIFCAKNLGYQIPAATIAKYWCSWSNKGGDSLSYIHLATNFISTMTKNNEIASKVKHSSRTCTLRRAKSVSMEKFSIEKNAKNKAYAFIL